jgi:geranylgeranyl diphosphate synthase type II
MRTSLDQRLKELRGCAEERLDAALHARPGQPASLLEAMRYSVLAPGKRVRPILVALAAEACGGEEDPWPAACAVEMIHAYSLIHDDLPSMDDDDIRRGQPACHKKFGEAMAILAGDALQALAFELLADAYPPATSAACCLELARAVGAAGMVGGQVDDLAWERNHGADQPTVEGLECLHDRKTGALVGASLKLGVLVAHTHRQPPEAELLERFAAYGRCLGLAFQITDDLLDVEGDADQTGKRVQKDAARGKLTYPGLVGTVESRRRAARLGRDARDYLLPLGTRGGYLLDLITLVLERDR